MSKLRIQINLDNPSNKFKKFLYKNNFWTKGFLNLTLISKINIFLFYLRDKIDIFSFSRKKFKKKVFILSYTALEANQIQFKILFSRINKSWNKTF